MTDSDHTYVFMDESGDAGFKLSGGSSPLFTIAAVIYESPAAITATEGLIQQVRAELRLPMRYEFKFSSESDRFRTAFCTAMAMAPFRIRAIVVDKERIYSHRLRNSPDDFYQFIAEQLLEHNFGTIANAKVYIDGSMKQELRTQLRQRLNRETRIIHDIRFYDSKQNDNIQLADMVAGAIARSYKGVKDGGKYRGILRPRIDRIWEYDEQWVPSVTDPHY